jgi:hypothetical protein
MKTCFQAMVLAAGILLLGCKSGGLTPQEHLENADGYAQWADSTADYSLAFRTLSGYKHNNEMWNLKIGYGEKGPIVIRMMAADDRADKHWIYLDSATGKVVSFKEETRGADGKGVRNRFVYEGDSVVASATGQNPYKPEGDDWRMKGAELNKLAQTLIGTVEADRPDLTPPANAARRQNAQFYALGPRNSFTIIINPSLSSVITTWDGGKTELKFGYSYPSTGPLGESIYEFGSLKDKLQVSIFSKYCGMGDGKNYPYTIEAKLNGKVYAGCGVLLQ